MAIQFGTILLALAGVAAAQQDLPRLDGGGGATQPPAAGWKLAKPEAQPATMATTPATGTFGKPSPVTPALPATAAVAAPAQPPTPADRPAEPATVLFHDGLLTIHATNSSLPEILTQVTAKTGMAVEGTPTDERVFGDFGPAPVSKVMAQLLDGGSSNYMMFGKAANEAPRSLVLTPRVISAPETTLAGGTPAPAALVANNDDDDDDDPPAPVAPIRPLMPAQGAENQQNQNPNPGVRTPQQILEDMQRRRQEQQQQQSQ